MSAEASHDYPPPPYEEAVSASTRQPPFPRPESLQTHRIAIDSEASSLSLPFPDPADVWQNRDITSQDWASLASDIEAVLTSDGEPLGGQKQVDTDVDRRRRVNETLAAWNARFFERRGLTLILNGTDTGSGASTNTASRFNFGPDKFGIRIGTGIIGVDLSSKEADTKK